MRGKLTIILAAALVRDAIQQTKGDVEVSGIYNLTPEDYSGLGVDSMVMVQVKDGKFVLAKQVVAVSY